MKPTDFSYHLSNYLSKYLPGVTGLSQNTIMSYRDAFSSVIRFFEENLEIKAEKITLTDLNADNLTKYLEWLEKCRGNSTSTRNNRLAELHAFAKYVEHQAPDYMHTMQEIISIPVKKSPTSIPKYLTVEALQLMLSQPNRNKVQGRRDCVLLSLLYDSGARVQELCDLIASDVRLTSPSTIRLTGKGAKTRIVPLMPRMVDLLKQYIHEQDLTAPAHSCYPLFKNHCGEKLTRKGISYILNKYYRVAMMQCPSLFSGSISPHQMRHSKSMHLLQSGVNLIYIRDILGHADVKTTEIYARIDTEMKRKALEKSTQGIFSEVMPFWQADKGLLEWLKNLK